MTEAQSLFHRLQQHISTPARAVTTPPQSTAPEHSTCEPFLPPHSNLNLHS